ncbi:MAG: magnesium-translocating P-type ATPase [Verrucomicrobiota bacterium]
MSFGSESKNLSFQRPAGIPTGKSLMDGQQRQLRVAGHWLLWLFGGALLATVVVASLHFAEAREFVMLARSSQPWWLLVAVLLQAGTYFAEGQVYRCVASAANFPLALPTVYKLSLAKLFVDQALPSAGVSGNVMVASFLERRGMPRPVVAASVVINLVAYYGVYVMGLVTALILAVVHDEVSRIIFEVALGFCCYAIAVTLILVGFAGRKLPESVRRIVRFRLFQKTLDFLENADRDLTHNIRVLLISSGYQLSIFLLDSATVWILIQSLGMTASVSGVFTSFMISTLFRSVGILPGGLGSFEAASILTLKMAGVPVAVGLSVTLLFRGLSFWIPMLPGLWSSRRIMAQRSAGSESLKLKDYWSIDVSRLFSELHCNPDGLSGGEAELRLQRYGANELNPKKTGGAIALLIGQFKTPIVLILLSAAGLSLFLRDATDAFIILFIIAVSGMLGFWQEKTANNAVKELLALVEIKAAVLRDGKQQELPVRQIVPGDIVIVNTGDVVPADGRILESKNLFVDEATLTGETFPAQKFPGLIEPNATFSQRTNVLFMGTHVISGTGRFVAVGTGKQTEFGTVSERLKLRPLETEFEHGVRRFGYFLLELTLLLVLAIFAFNVYLARPVLDSLLFALALAVGLTPQLLPAIISVNLAHGARRMAAQKVIVKRLSAIENFGSMTVLCSDKTGTLTEGRVTLQAAMDISGMPSQRVMTFGALNSHFQTGYTNPMDRAILARQEVDETIWRKLDEIPYDFSRRRMSVLVSNGKETILITKGAFTNVLAICSRAERSDGGVVDLAVVQETINDQMCSLGERGLRVLAVAFRIMSSETTLRNEDENEMTFLGLLSFSDSLRANIEQTLNRLRGAGIALKIITGVHHLVALEVSQQAGFMHPKWLSGRDLEVMSDEALIRRVTDIDVFAEVEPNQKERLILALRKSGHVVGYMGDGINDASALHAAVVGISVSGAADVAKAAADIVLLEKGLAVLARGVQEGRVTFANTLKYVFMATSANFGNMFSMAGASLFLPFLPLLPKQILLVNLLTDLPEMTIANDRVDEEWTRQPHRWNLKFIRRFMVAFGLLSSVFDYATFALLILFLQVPANEFRSAWFVESIISASIIVLVIRSPRRLLKSIPGKPLMIVTALTCVLAVVLPLSPIASSLGLTAIPGKTLMMLGMIVACYVLAAEGLKRLFFRHAQLP